MNVFITGASGYVGSAIGRRLVAAGHQVSGLSRSGEADARLREAGVEPVRGDLAAPEVPAAAAAQADAVVHAAIDYADPAFGDVERPALRALLDASRGPVVYLSSTLVYGDTGDAVATEERTPAPTVQPFKLESERATLSAGGTVLRSALVYGPRGSALIDGMHDAARRQGVVRYVGHGTNRWSLVHADDLADAVRLALERPCPGTVLNVADGHAPAMREIAASVAAEHGVPAAPIDVADAAAAMGDFAEQLTRDLVVDAGRARALLGWRPAAPPLVTERPAAA